MPAMTGVRTRASAIRRRVLGVTRRPLRRH